MIELEPEVKKDAAWGCYGSAQALSGLGVITGFYFNSGYLVTRWNTGYSAPAITWQFPERIACANHALRL